MRFMFETGLRGVEGKPVGLGKLPRRSLSKEEGKVFSASKASSALAISCLCWIFGDFWALNINDDLSRGWTLLYTLPSAIIGEFALLLVAAISIISHRKRKNA